MADNLKVLARTLQAETGWKYQACRQLIEKHACDYEKALAEVRRKERG